MVKQDPFPQGVGTMTHLISFHEEKKMFEKLLFFFFFWKKFHFKTAEKVKTSFLKDAAQREHSMSGRNWNCGYCNGILVEVNVI